MKSKGCLVEISNNLTSWTAVQSYLQAKNKAGEKYATISLIPGHGCYPLLEVVTEVDGVKTKTMVLADPGMVWSQNAMARSICGDLLGRRVTLSGWTHAVLLNRDDIFDKFRCQRHVQHNLAYIVRDLHVIDKRARNCK